MVIAGRGGDERCCCPLQSSGHRASSSAVVPRALRDCACVVPASEHRRRRRRRSQHGEWDPSADVPQAPRGPTSSHRGDLGRRRANHLRERGEPARSGSATRAGLSEHQPAYARGPPARPPLFIRAGGTRARASGRMRAVDVTRLTDEERRWLEADERRWQLAHRIVERYSELDVGDVYHTIVQLERTPAERLKRGLRRGLARAVGS